jgi:hypothetical protein
VIFIALLAAETLPSRAGVADTVDAIGIIIDVSYPNPFDGSAHSWTHANARRILALSDDSVRSHYQGLPVPSLNSRRGLALVKLLFYN